MNQVTRETSRFVDKYDVTLDVCLSSVLSQSKILSPHVRRRRRSLSLFAAVLCSAATSIARPPAESDLMKNKLCCNVRAGAGRAADRRVRGGRDGEVPQPPGRAGGAAREARRRRQVGGLQQVQMQSLFHFRTFLSMILSEQG